MSSDDSSIAGASEPDETPAAGGDVADGGDTRYRVDGILGRGGMGEVLLAHDLRLGRDVALKRVALPAVDDARSQRLVREARITAQLEHPNIVPVYDAGARDGGRFYTMRLVRGRPLSSLLADDVADRLGLLRAFATVCDAVAYAHSRGIVHRDLKPTNIMVGDYGEVLVVDWGIAARTADPPPKRPVGTPGYVSPEQARGGGPDPRDDVFSLGCVLHLVLAGAPLRAGSKQTMLDVARATDVGLGPLRAAAAPAELVAIAERALAPPEARYPDASALADDLGRYLDGRRVGAYAYSRLELARRFVSSFRLPLLVALVSAVLLATLGALAWTRTRGAERTARAALARAEATLAWSLDAQAVTALAAGAHPEAEVLAAHALLRAESADARGVLAATRSPAALVVERIEVGPGERVLDTDGAALLVESAGEVVYRRGAQQTRIVADAIAGRLVRGGFAVLGADRALRIHRADGAVLHERPTMSRRIGLRGDPGGEAVLWSDGHDLARVVVDGPASPVETPPCGGGGVEAVALGELGALVACDGRLHVGGASLVTGVRFASAIAVDGGMAAVGSVDGRVALLDLRAGRVVASRSVADAPIEVLALSAGRVVVGPAGGSASLWDLESDSELLRLPGGALTAARSLPGGRLALVGRLTTVVRIEGPVGPRRLYAPEGLASVAVSPDGTRLATARGDGVVDVWSAVTGARISSTRLSDGVVKRVAWSGDGATLGVGLAGEPGSAWIDATTGAARAHERLAVRLRRVVVLGASTLVGAPYAPGLHVWGGAAWRVVETPRAVDLETTPDRAQLVMLAWDGAVLAAGRELVFREVTRDPKAVAVAASDGLATLVVARPRGVTIHRGGGVRVHDAGGRELTDVAVSADGETVALGTRGGAIELVEARTGASLAVLRGHDERVSAVVFAPGGWLVSASWDGTVIRWDLAAARLDAASALRDASRRWGLALDDALRVGNP